MYHLLNCISISQSVERNGTIRVALAQKSVNLLKIKINCRKKQLDDIVVAHNFSRQRGRMGKNVVFTTTLIEWSGFNPHPGHAVASLDKTLYDDWWLRTSTKFSGQEFEEIHRSNGSSETPKQVRIPPITK